MDAMKNAAGHAAHNATPDDEVREALEAFAECEERDRDNFNAGQDDIRFARLEEQWPAAIRAQRIREGRPCFTINKLPSFIRQVVNDARQNKPAIKVQPQDSGADPQTADLISGLIRNIETTSDAEVAYDTAVECATTNGFGYFRVNLRYANDDNWEQDIVIERVADPFTKEIEHPALTALLALANAPAIRNNPDASAAVVQARADATTIAATVTTAASTVAAQLSADVDPIIKDLATGLQAALDAALVAYLGPVGTALTPAANSALALLEDKAHTLLTALFHHVKATTPAAG
jgi:hypothetical protein